MAIKTSTLALIIVAILAVGAMTGFISWTGSTIKIGSPSTSPTVAPGGGVGGVFAGNLAITTAWFDHGNNDVATTTVNASVKILHADGSLFGQTSVGAVISGQVYPADNGLLTVIMTPVSTAYIASDWTTSQNQGAAKLSTVSAVAVSGVNVYKWTLDISKEPALGGGESTRAVTINVGEYTADVSGLVYTSSVNATSTDFSGTSYIPAAATGYIGGFTQKDAFKIVKVELSMPDAGNISMYDNGQIKQIQVKIGMGNGQPDLYVSNFQHYTGGTYLEGQIGVTDVSQEYYGLPVVYGISDSTSNLGYTISLQGANFGSTGTFLPTLIVTYISPSGTTGTISRVVSFVDT